MTKAEILKSFGVTGGEQTEAPRSSEPGAMVESMQKLLRAQGRLPAEDTASERTPTVRS